MKRIIVNNLSIFHNSSISSDFVFGEIDMFRCKSAYCIGFEGCVPHGNIRSIPFGMGLPIPDVWACVPNEFVPDDIPDDFESAMIKIACFAGLKGKFFKPDVTIYYPCQLSQKANIEAHVNSSSLKCAGSIWLNKTSSESPSLTLVGGFKPLLVSGFLSWGTKAVFESYCSALSEIGIQYGKFEYDILRKTFTSDVSLKMLLAECVDKRNEYTHIIVTDGLSIPSWILESCGLKKILISTEDPYSIDITSSMHAYYDYIMSNELTSSKGLGLSYLPTAADIKRCQSAVNRAKSMGNLKYDVCFIGAVYPDRKEILMSIYDMCKKSGLKMFAGGTCKNSDLADMPFFTRGEFSTDDTLLAQASSKICVNMFRRPYGDESRDNNKFKLLGESMSPRCYDAPACGAAVITDYRKEVVDIYGEKCVFNKENVAEMIFSLLKEKKAEEIAVCQLKEVVRSHTYVHRCSVMLSAVEKGMMR